MARLTIPKGEYRIEAHPIDPERAEGPDEPERRRNMARWALGRVAAGLLCVVVANVLIWKIAWPTPPKDPFTKVRKSAIWSGILRTTGRSSWRSAITTSSERPIRR